MIVCYNLALPISILIFAGTYSFVEHTFRTMHLLGVVESIQGIILLGKMWRRVTFGNVYWEFDCVHT